MIYTKEQLDAMSDHDVSIAIYKKLGWSDKQIEEYLFTGLTYLFTDCWNKIMPIAVDNLFSIVPFGETTQVIDHYSGNEVENENPRRAICEIFLMMDVK